MFGRAEYDADGVQNAVDHGQNRSDAQKECGLHQIGSCLRTVSRKFSTGLGAEVWPNTRRRVSIVGRIRGLWVRLEDGFGHSWQLPQLADFDGAFRTAAGGRNFGGPGDSLVQIGAVQHIVAGELLLGFGEGPVDRQHFTVFHADGGSCIGSPEGIHGHEHAALSSLVDHRVMALPNLFRFLGWHRSEVAFPGVDQHHVTHSLLLVRSVACRTPLRRASREKSTGSDYFCAVPGSKKRQVCHSSMKLKMATSGESRELTGDEKSKQ